jgi:predicted molibdopterin-dependent oxidoreductase YjgC
LLPLGPTWSRPPGPSALAAVSDGTPPAGAANGLWLLSGGTLFLQGSLSYRGELLPRLAKHARAWLHPGEASRLAVGDGETIELSGPGGVVRLPAALDDAVPLGAVFVPYAYAEVELNRLGVAAGGGLKVAARKAASERVGA